MLWRQPQPSSPAWMYRRTLRNCTIRFAWPRPVVMYGGGAQTHEWAAHAATHTALPVQPCHCALPVLCPLAAHISMGHAALRMSNIPLRLQHLHNGSHIHVAQVAGRQEPASCFPPEAVEAALLWADPWLSAKIFGAGLYALICFRQVAVGGEMQAPKFSWGDGSTYVVALLAASHLAASQAPHTVCKGCTLTNTLGTGCYPRRAAAAAADSVGDRRAAVDGGQRCDPHAAAQWPAAACRPGAL